jgi:predicted secreted protein
MGLGAKQVAVDNARKLRTPHESEGSRKPMVAAVDQDGKRRNWKTLDEKVTEQSDLPKVHQLVVIIGGRMLLLLLFGLLLLL